MFTRVPFLIYARFQRKAFTSLHTRCFRPFSAPCKNKNVPFTPPARLVQRYLEDVIYDEESSAPKAADGATRRQRARQLLRRRRHPAPTTVAIVSAAVRAAHGTGMHMMTP